MKNCFALLFTLCTALAAWGQDFTAAPACAAVQPEFIKHLPTGPGFVPFTINIPGGVVALTWSYNLGTANCASAFSVASNGTIVALGGNLQATFNNNGGTKNIVISAAGSLAEGERLLTVKLNYSGLDRVKQYRFIVRDPLQMVLVLDRSGSMECDIDEAASGATWPGCSTSNTAGDATDNVRWHMLRDAIDAFVNKLDNNHKLTTDQIGVVYFSGSTAVQGSLTNDGLEFAPVNTFQIPLAGGHTPIYNEMNTAPPGGAPLARDGTSLGEGVYKAIFDRFNNTEDAAKRQVVLLFTDGEQNTGKWMDGLGKLIKASSAPDAATSLNTAAATLDAIEIYSAGLINVPAAELLLQNIADNHTPANPSYFNVMPGNISGFGNEMAGNAFNEIYNDYSPQFVRFDKHVLPYNSSAQSVFTFNKNVNRVIFDAYFDAPLAKLANYTILKDGVDVTSKVSKVNINEYVATYIFNMYDLPDLTSEGNWTFKVANSDDQFQKNQIQLYATADDHHVEFDGYLTNGRIHVGQSLQANVQVTVDGQPVTNGTVTATIIKPGDDLGHLLATSNISNLPPKSTEIGTCATQKLDYLETNNKAALSQWKNLQSRTITLQHTSKGVYTGNYNDVDVTGNYKIIYHFKAATSTTGTLERMEDQTIHVRFAPIEISKSRRAIKSNQDGAYFHTLTLNPTYEAPNGSTRFLGPGYEGMFRAEGAQLSSVSDGCDGTYELVLRSPDKNPNVRLSVADDQFYSGGLQDITGEGKNRKWNLSIHGGTTLPTSKLDSLFNRGNAFEVDLAYRIRPHLSAEVVGGYYAFKPTYKILGGTAYLKAHFNTGAASQVFIGAGAGLYQPDDLTLATGGIQQYDLAPGYSIRLGIERFIGQRLSLGVDMAGFYIPEHDFSYGVAVGSIRYKL